MKLLGGPWSRADAFALTTIVIAVIALVPPFLSVPGVLTPGTPVPTPAAEPVRGPRSSPQVTSGQLNFGCDSTTPATTPVIDLGKNPKDVVPTAGWTGVSNAKAKTQQVVQVGSQIHAVGSITGLDKVVGNCPGGGHGELTLTVAWTAEQ